MTQPWGPRLWTLAQSWTFNGKAFGGEHWESLWNRMTLSQPPLLDHRVRAGEGVPLALGVGREPVCLCIFVCVHVCVCVCVCMCSWQRELVRNALDSRFPKRRWLIAQVAKLLRPEASQGLANNLLPSTHGCDLCCGQGTGSSFWLGAGWRVCGEPASTLGKMIGNLRQRGQT